MPSSPRHFAPIDFKTRFPALDGIRALAVTLVFADHYGGGSHGGGVLRVINVVRQRGWVGVDLFFVLSGFLITGILYDTRVDSRFFQRFFARRAVRIFPVFYLVVALLLLLTPVLHYQWHWLQLTFLIYMGNFFGNANFGLYEIASRTHPAASATIGHFWSLCVEEQFYLLWPVIVFFVRDRIRLIRVALGLSLLALLLRLAMLARFSTTLSETWIVRTLPFRMDALLLGGILALLLRGPASDRWQRAGRWVFLAATAAVLALFALSPAYDSPWLLSIGLTSPRFRAPDSSPARSAQAHPPSGSSTSSRSAPSASTATALHLPPALPQRLDPVPRLPRRPAALACAGRNRRPRRELRRHLPRRQAQL